MNWYYVENGQQAGPIDDAQLEALVRSGKIQANTLVWHEGMADWQPFHYVQPAGLRASPPLAAPPPMAAPPTGAPGEVACTECGRFFAPGDVIRYGGSWVCAACKPIFLQRLSEGAALGNAGPRPVFT